MKKNLSKLRLVFGALLLLCGGVVIADAQPAAGQGTTPGERRRPRAEGGPELYNRSADDQSQANTVVVRIRYKTEYGYKSPTTYGKPVPTSCSAFSVALAKPATPMRPNYLIPVNRDDMMIERDGYYYCHFVVSELALDQDVTIKASVDDQGQWLGAQTQLPGGYRRVLTDVTRTVTLTQSEPRATMNFEMFYEPLPDFTRTKPLPSDAIRKP